MTDSRKLAAQMPGFPGRAEAIVAALIRRRDERLKALKEQQERKAA